MARLISQTGQTTNVTIGSPQQGMKWIIRWAAIVMHTGSTTGSRQSGIYISRANSYAHDVIANTGGQSGTNTTYAGAGEVFSNSFSATIYIQFSQYPEVFSVDILATGVALQSGDTYDYYVLVEEASS